MGEIYGCEIVVDDATARQIAEEKKLQLTSTVALLCDAIRANKLTTVMVETQADVTDTPAHREAPGCRTPVPT